MNWKWLAICGICLGVSIAAMAENEKPKESAESPRKDAPQFKSLQERASYAIGFTIGSNLARQQVEVDAKIFARGFVDAMSKQKPILTEEELQATMQEFQKELQTKMIARQKVESEKNAKEGIAFLEKNGKRKGVVTLKSGLQYEVLKEGNGKIPKENDTVKTHYHGTFIDGKVFDSSVERKEPATFPVKEVIKGWTEALQLMKVGSKWKLYVPAALAYDKRGYPPKIGPDTVLIFEIELLGIEG